MSIELEKLKSILETAKKLQKGEIESPETLDGLIIAYDDIAKKLNKPTELPLIYPYDEDKDIGWTGYTKSGHKKITDLITYTEGYVNAHAQTSPIVNKAEGWNKANVIAIMSIIIATLVTIGIYTASQMYQVGVSNGKTEMQREYDAEKIGLSQKLDSLKTEYNIINDSLKACNVNIIAKNDSISFLLSKDKQANNNKKGSAK